MNLALRKKYFDKLGLVGLQTEKRYLDQIASLWTAVLRNRMAGGVRGGGSNPAAYSMYMMLE